MATSKKEIREAIAYDHTRVRDFFKKRGGWVISWYERQRTETLSHDLELHITAEQLPRVVFFNGQKMHLREAPQTTTKRK